MEKKKGGKRRGKTDEMSIIFTPFVSLHFPCKSSIKYSISFTGKISGKKCTLSLAKSPTFYVCVCVCVCAHSCNVLIFLFSPPTQDLHISFPTVLFLIVSLFSSVVQYVSLPPVLNPHTAIVVWAKLLH